MLNALARFLIRRRVAVLAAALVAVAVAGAFGGGVAENLTSGGFGDPDAESARAAGLLEEQFEQGEINLALLVTAAGGVDDPEVAAAGMALTEELAAEADVADVGSYWSLQAPPLASTDRTQALVLGRIEGPDDAVNDRVEQLTEAYTRDGPVIDVAVGGSAETFRQIGETIESDLVRAEAIAFPITLILLVIVFGSIVAALLPLAVGVLAVLGTFLVLQLLTGVTDVSIYALNLTTALGLGLAIDYSLFVVSRFREELAGSSGPGTRPTREQVNDAVLVTVRTAGKTVAFSAGTVAISLAALLLFPQVFMRSFAYAGTAVVLVAAVGAVVVLPALLAVLGHRVDSLTLFRRHPEREGRGWARVAHAVMRRPLPIATAVVALLILLGLPFLGVEFGTSDDRVLPIGNEVRLVAQDIRENFEGREAAALSVVAPDTGSTGLQELAGYASTLSTIEGVERVDAATGSYIGGRQVFGPTPASQRFADEAGTWLSVVPSVEPISSEGEKLVADVRAADAPFDVLVGGLSAFLVDDKEALFSRVPLAVGLIALTTFALLFLMFGSLLVPVKALVLNTLSLTAVFGAMVWIFQDGNLSGVLGFTATGALDTTMPILMFCMAFGLSMDYEVFLLSRIKEEHDRTGDNTQSVAVGLQRTGRIVTAAAALLAVVFVAFATSGVSIMKLFGLGLALAVVMDATLVRATLVPAFMRLAGEANWWLPRGLRRVYDRFGLREGEAAPEPDTTQVPVGAGR